MRLVFSRNLQKMSLVVQELPTLPEHLGSRSVFSGERIAQSVVLWLLITS